MIRPRKLVQNYETLSFKLLQFRSQNYENNLRIYVLFLAEVAESNAGIFHPLCTYAVKQAYKFILAN